MSSRNTPRRNWFKSSFSDSSNNCVEVRFADDVVLIRDDKYTGPTDLQPVIAVPNSTWSAFLEVVLDGDARDSSIALPSITTGAHGTMVRDAVGTTLEFTPAEWTAFLAGIRAGEFAPAAV